MVEACNLTITRLFTSQLRGKLLNPPQCNLLTHKRRQFNFADSELIDLHGSRHFHNILV